MLRSRVGPKLTLVSGLTRTSSTLTAQTVLEADGGRAATAAAYLGVTVLGGMLAAVAGYALGRQLA